MMLLKNPSQQVMPRKETTAYTIHYNSRDHTRGYVAWPVYRNILGCIIAPYGRTTQAHTVVAALWSSHGYRSIAIKQMESRIWYFAIMEYFGLKQNSTDLDGYLSIVDLDCSYFQWQAHAKNDIPSPWEYLLLQYAQTLCGYINYEAVGAHKDGQGDETLSLYSRPKGDAF